MHRRAGGAAADRDACDSDAGGDRRCDTRCGGTYAHGYSDGDRYSRATAGSYRRAPANPDSHAHCDGD